MLNSSDIPENIRHSKMVSLCVRYFEKGKTYSIDDNFCRPAMIILKKLGDFQECS